MCTSSAYFKIACKAVKRTFILDNLMPSPIQLWRALPILPCLRANSANRTYSQFCKFSFGLFLRTCRSGQPPLFATFFRKGTGLGTSAGFIFQYVSRANNIYFFQADLNIICRHGHVVIVLYTIPNNICK